MSRKSRNEHCVSEVLEGSENDFSAWSEGVVTKLDYLMGFGGLDTYEDPVEAECYRQIFLKIVNSMVPGLIECCQHLESLRIAA